MKTVNLWIIMIILAAVTVGCSAQNATSTAIPISEIPRPGHVTDLWNLSNTLLTFGTDMHLNDILAFYRDTLTKEGYTERTKLTFTTDTAFGLVFDGYPGGKEIVIQGATLGNDTSTVTIRLLDVDDNQ